MDQFNLLDFDIFGFEPLKLFENPADPPVKTMAPVQNDLNYSKNLGDPRLETKDPTPNIWEMFRDFDQRFFNGVLVRNGVQVDWSSKMTRCAGLCSWRSNTLACEIKLSKPLLQLRSRKDLVETLIHEMIHALLFVTRDSDNRESHGPKFHAHMYRINKEASLNISVYHTFHDEVRHYQTHVWRCKGICSQRAPYYGWVRRSMNRAPDPNDPWWTQHQQTCGGVFEKVSEPEGYGKKKSPKKENQPSAGNQMQMKDIRNYFSPTKAADRPSTSSRSTNQSGAHGIVDFDSSSPDKASLPGNLVPFSGKGRALGGGSTNGPPSGVSNLLAKFLKKPKEETSSNAKTSNVKNFKPIRNDQLIVLDDSESERIRPFVDTLDEPVDLISPPRKRKRLANETLNLSEDDEDFSWLDTLKDHELLGSPSCIIID